MIQNSLPKNLLPAQLFEVSFGSFFEAASRRPAEPQNHNKIGKTHCLNHFLHSSASVAAYVLSSKENSRRESLQQFSPCVLPAAPGEGEDAHTIRADCLGVVWGLVDGRANTDTHTSTQYPQMVGRDVWGCGDDTPQASSIILIIRM